MDSFAGRVVLITGAGSGIGREFAHRLAAEGAKVAALDIHADSLAKLHEELSGRPFAGAAADVTDLSATRSAVAQLEGQLGPIDLLIASAGIGRETSALSYRGEDVAAQIAVNLIGVSNSIDAVLPGMLKRGRGHLVALSSLASYRGLPRMLGYCASKAGVSSLLEGLRVELEPTGIAVTTLCPGWIRTPLTGGFLLSGFSMMEVGPSVEQMLTAIRQRRAKLAFPAGTAFQVRLLRLLPNWLSDRLIRLRLQRLPRA